MKQNAITITALIDAPMNTVWEKWTNPADVMNWNNASDDWHTPKAENDLRIGGKFSYTMAAKDGSFSFDFGGTYTDLIEHKLIEYALGDEREISISFVEENGMIIVTEKFDPEQTNPLEMQQAGWQAILNNFKKYVESSK